MSKFSKLTTREYKGIVDLAQYLDQGRPAKRAKNSSLSDYGSDWTLGVDYDDAVSMALDGGWWEEGAAKMISAQIKASSFLNDVVMPEMDWDVTGQRIDIDEYLNGTPECWVTEEDVVQEAKVIKVGFSAFMCCDVPANQAINRGAALLSVIDELEAQGYRVELWAGLHQKSDYVMTDGRVLLKDAADVWSPSSIAFAMCHPAFSRRLGFRWLELHDDTCDLTHSGYGHGMDNKDMDNTYDVYFDYFNAGSQWETVESAVREVAGNFEQYLEREAA